MLLKWEFGLIFIFYAVLRGKRRTALCLGCCEYAVKRPLTASHSIKTQPSPVLSTAKFPTQHFTASTIDRSLSTAKFQTQHF